MSESAPAIFLSYASQDVGAAERIATTLRAHGMEVWFDQNALSGGDSWDKKIRDQIQSCALFMPVISANTQARTEGYFRLEWRLAEQRTHLMAKGRPFLVPIVIDDTHDSEAHVPDAFFEVQWSRFKDGLVDDAFANRVEELLNTEVTRQAFKDRPDLFGGSPPAAAPPPKESKTWLFFAIPGMLVGLFFALAPVIKGLLHRSDSNETVATTSKAESLKLADRAWNLLTEDPLRTRRNVELAETLAMEAIEADATDADAFAAAALANFVMLDINYDNSSERRDKLRRFAETAELLAPDTLRSQIAMAVMLRKSGRRDEAIERLVELSNQAPDNFLIQSELLELWAWMDDETWIGATGIPTTPLNRLRGLSLRGQVEVDTLLAGQAWAKGEYPEADRLLDQVFNTGSPNRTSYLIRLLVLTFGWGELDQAEAFAETIPEKLLLEDVFINHVFTIHLWQGDYDTAIAVLNRTQRDMLQEALIQEPRDQLRGLALEARGSVESAKIAWESALRVVDAQLAEAPQDLRARLNRARLLGYLGDEVTARKEFELLLDASPVNYQQFLTTFGADLFLRWGDNEEAIKRLRGKMSKDNPRWPNTYHQMRYDPLFRDFKDLPEIQEMIKTGAAWLEELRDQTPATP